MQAGFNGMNNLVIIQTAQGLVKCLLNTFSPKEVMERGVAIGYDGRHNSKRYGFFFFAIEFKCDYLRISHKF